MKGSHARKIQVKIGKFLLVNVEQTDLNSKMNDY